jgi:pyrroline-5-carboxylate reductase
MTSQQKSIGIIGGGQMAEALIKGMLQADLFSASNIYVLDPSVERQNYLNKQYNLNLLHEPEELCSVSDVLLLAVKPQIFPNVIVSYASFIGKEQLLISIMAGVTMRKMLEAVHENCKIVRVMPNTPALVLEAASAFTANEHCGQEDIDLVVDILSAVGACVQVPEYQLDAVTGLSGSGPGYVFTIIDAFIDGGVFAGLPRDVAKKLVLQTIYGSAKLALENEEVHPSQLKAQVTSPGGTTIYGIKALEEYNIRTALMEAVNRATLRSQELGK